MLEHSRVVAILKAADTYEPEDLTAAELEKIKTTLRLAFVNSGEDAIDEFELPVAFNVADKEAVDYANKRGGELVTMIKRTQREDIRELVALAIQEGWSPQHFSSELRGKFTFSRARAAMIARTETAIAYNAGKTSTYRNAGISYVYVYDGDYDEECQQANGSIWSLEQAEANPIEHPNCKRTFRPATAEEVNEFLRSAGRIAA